MTINNYDSQISLHRQEIYWPKWLILCVMIHFICDMAFTATGVVSKI